VPRFEVVYCDAAGPCPSQATDCDGSAATDLMRDRLTGLEWPRDPGAAGAGTWTEALAIATAFGRCGRTDFRLPNVNELTSLMRCDETPYDAAPVGPKSPAGWLMLQGFLEPSMSWTSTTYVANPVIAEVVDVFTGENVGEFKTASLAVFPVRGDSVGPARIWRTGQSTCWNADGQLQDCALTGQDGDLQRGAAWPQPRFADNGDGTVGDLLTGLVWLKDTACLGSGSWSDAMARVADFQAAPGPFACSGYLPSGRTWRLPSTVELRSLVDRSRSGPALPAGHPFVGIPTYVQYWSSTTTTFTLSTANGWVLFVTNGASGGNLKGSTNSVWPVSGGDLGALFLDGFESGDASAWSSASDV
jgi:hypothetical protein